MGANSYYTKEHKPYSKENDSPKSVRERAQEQAEETRCQGIAAEEPSQALDGNTEFAAQRGKQRNKQLIVSRG